ncbi:MAG: hypothetical protein SA339_12585 [Methanomassiliicoccus sp.]|nr:hypothetical protein [Methanomassiliicoccus sp.]
MSLETESKLGHILPSVPPPVISSANPAPDNARLKHEISTQVKSVDCSFIWVKETTDRIAPMIDTAKDAKSLIVPITAVLTNVIREPTLLKMIPNIVASIFTRSFPRIDLMVFSTVEAAAEAISPAALAMKPSLASSIAIITIGTIMMMAILETTPQVIGDAVDAASSAIGEAGQAIVESVLGSALVNDVAMILSIILGGMSALLDSIVFTVGGSFLTFAFSLFGAFLSIIAMVEVLSSGCSLDILMIAILGAVASGSAISWPIIIPRAWRKSFALPTTLARI